jgi:outer membrane receptor protein involved in Fe transport
VRYRLQLGSNLTFAQDRPAEGDPFLQRDSRSVAGGAVSPAFSHTLAGLPARSEPGAQLRHDSIRVGLLDTETRQIKATTRDDDLRQTLLGVYGQSTVERWPWLRGVVGLRAAHLRNRVDALSLAAKSDSARGTQVSPKLSLIAGPFEKTEFFVSAGRGLRTSDVRGSSGTPDLNSVHSVPSITVNLRISRSLQPLPGKNSAVTLDAFNLFDRRVNDLQCCYGSPPRDLAAADDRPVHPAQPRTLRLTLRVGF